MEFDCVGVAQAKSLVAAILGCDLSSSEVDVGLSCKLVKSAEQGDLFFSRKTAARVKEKLREKASGCHLSLCVYA